MKYCTFLLMTFFAIQGFAQISATIENGFAKTAQDAKSISISVISTEQASKLFKKISTDKTIPFAFSMEGCYAKATAMARIAEKDKVIMGKVFAEGDLQAQTTSPYFPLDRWGWHVAPVVYVQDANQKPQLMVFDPTLFDHPAPVEEWKSKLLYKTKDFKPQVKKLYFGARYQYNPSFMEDSRVDWNSEDVAHSEVSLQAARCKLDIQDCDNRTGSLYYDEYNSAAKEQQRIKEDYSEAGGR